MEIDIEYALSHTLNYPAKIQKLQKAITMDEVWKAHIHSVYVFASPRLSEWKERKDFRIQKYWREFLYPQLNRVFVFSHDDFYLTMLPKMPYKPLNQKMLRDLLRKGKRILPVEYTTLAHGFFRKTEKGWLFFILAGGGVFIFTSHCFERMGERHFSQGKVNLTEHEKKAWNTTNEIDDDFTLVNTKKAVARTLMHMVSALGFTHADKKACGVVRGAGWFMGPQTVLECDVGFFKKNTRIALAKTFIDFESRPIEHSLKVFPFVSGGNDVI